MDDSFKLWLETGKVNSIEALNKYIREVLKREPTSKDINLLMSIHPLIDFNHVMLKIADANNYTWTTLYDKAGNPIKIIY